MKNSLIILGLVGLGIWFLTKRASASGPVYDVNGNGEIDMGDVVYLESHYMGPVTDVNRKFDYNGDGVVDGLDVAILENYILTH